MALTTKTQKKEKIHKQLTLTTRHQLTQITNKNKC